jgi:transposase InsO family protein
VKRLHELCSPPAPNLNHFVPRGDVWQRSQRQREHDLRRQVVALTNSWTNRHGLSYQQSAARLDLKSRTLRRWRAGERAAGQQLPTAGPLLWQPLSLGRPARRSSRSQRSAVLALLMELGLGIGVPTLRDCFPHMPRAELDDILRRARHVCRHRYHQTQRVLHWASPGSVWAMDFTEVPALIDGFYPYVLAVRDLASGAQLLAWPLRTATALEANRALASLVAHHGAPLVLKTDNGSPFCAADTQNFLREQGVTMLFSPPYWPRYNGAIEAGIGSLKSRCEYHAACQGRPGQWIWDDIDWSLAQANASARPHGPSGPTPDQAWATRPIITQEERSLFQTSVQRHADEVCAMDGYQTIGPLQTMAQRAVDRQAIQRAFVEHGYLLFRRRRIPLPFEKKKVAIIP